MNCADNKMFWKYKKGQKGQKCTFAVFPVMTPKKIKLESFGRFNAII